MDRLETNNDLIHDAKSMIRAVRHELVDVADAAYVMGNEKLAATLMRACADLLEAHDMVGRAWGQEISDRCKEAWQQSQNILDTAIAVLSERGK